MRDLRAFLSGTQAVLPAVLTATPTAIAADRNLFEGLVAYVYVGIGGITFDGSNYLQLKAEESADNSTWTAVGANDLLGAVPDVNGIFQSWKVAKPAASVNEVGYIGSLRYFRVTPVFTGTHGVGTSCAGMYVFGYPWSAPAA